MIYELVITDLPEKFKPKKETNNLWVGGGGGGA